MRLFEGTQFDRPPRCEKCDKLEEECSCPPEPETPEPTTPVEKQTARLAREKRKRGKVVTVISGLLDEGEALADLLTRLKTTCGAGGTIKDGTLEIQGDHVDRVREQLAKIGYRVKG
ncbi:MAG: translation initiation factor [Planctomycetaceae bacterium]